MKTKLTKVLIIVIPIVFIITVVLLGFPRSEYKRLENQMVKKAKEYVKENKIDVTNQEYIFLEDLGIDDGAELCTRASGVIVTKIGSSLEYYPYLKCIDYESNVLNNSTLYIELNGPTVSLINLGTLYSDQGYKEKQEGLEIEQVGIVPNQVGAYTINYVVKKDGKQKAIVKRIVIVSNKDTEINITGLENSDKPKIVIKGEKEMTMLLGTKYVEPGFLAYDTEDGKLNKKVKIESNVDTTKVGEYLIIYSVKNSKGKEYKTQRKVKVVKELGNLEIKIGTTEDGAAINESTIEISVSGSGFVSMTLPDGTTSESNVVKYKAQENGTYVFKVKDEYGNFISKSITINHIDNAKPTGQCTLEHTSEGSIIKVVASDDRGIEGVDYILNGNETGFLPMTTYKTLENVAVAEAIIRDVAYNQTRLTCSVDENKGKNEEVYKFNYADSKPLITCQSYTAAEKKALESKLSTAINNAGFQTRAGVVEAARFLLGGLGHKVPYLEAKNSTIDKDQILGTYNKLGLNIGVDTGWGCQVNGFTQGLNGLSLVEWAFINGGVTLSNVYSPNNTYQSSKVANKIKPGDLMLTPCDKCKNGYDNVGIVIGIDSSKIYVAEANPDKGVIISEWTKKSMPTKGKFSITKLYEYDADGSLTDMWK